MAADLEKILSTPEVACSEPWLVGNSWGGTLALKLAERGRLRVRRMVLLSPGGLGGTQNSAARELLSAGTVDALREFQARAYARPRELPGFVWEAAARRLRNSPTQTVLSVQRPEDALSAERLSQLTIPTSVVWGLSDHVTPLEEARPFLAKLRFATVREVPECGHLPQKECPEAVLDAINELLGAGAG
jgi:pimeloyl-ACP methyl ester carboxylesterase